MNDQKQPSKAILWTSYILQALIVLPFIFGAFSNILKADDAVKMATEMNYPEEAVMYLGIILLVVVLLYAIPKTTVLGASLITAWLGGAVATHIIHGDPLGQTIIPVVFGVIVWFVLWLRMPSLKALTPFVK